MVELEELFDATYFGNTTWQWIVAAAIVVVVFFALLLLRRLIRSNYTRLVATPQTDLIELPLHVASRTTLGFMLIAAVFAGLQTLHLSPKAGKLALTAFTIAAFWQETSRAQLQRIPGILRSLIEAQQDTRLDRSHFFRIGATSYDFEAVYFVTTPDYNRHMDILQDINLRLIEAFETESIALAYPSQRLVLTKPGDVVDS